MRGLSQPIASGMKQFFREMQWKGCLLGPSMWKEERPDNDDSLQPESVCVSTCSWGWEGFPVMEKMRAPVLEDLMSHLEAVPTLQQLLFELLAASTWEAPKLQGWPVASLMSFLQNIQTMCVSYFQTIPNFYRAFHFNVWPRCT